MSIDLSLDPRFRLVHEPLHTDDHAWLAVGEHRVAAGLAERLRYSMAGSFLVTGFRGVGKTTAVREALRLYQHESGDDVIAVEISLARAPTREQLLFEMVRRLYEALADLRVLDRLTPSIQDIVNRAYARTSLAMKETRSQTDERHQQAKFGGTVTLGKGPGSLAFPVPSLDFGRKRSRGLATELSFLAYSDADAEHDLQRILASLRNPEAARRNRWYSAWSKIGLARYAQPLQARIVIVLDEIDKVTEREGGLKAFEGLLSSLKNLLSTPGVHFIVVGGVDLHDEWVRDTAGPNSLYRSVFSWHAYTPCVWNQAGELLRRVGASDQSDAHMSPPRLVSDYLEFTARGILRTLMFELNGLATWPDGQPHILIEDPEVRRIRLLSELQRELAEFLSDFEDLGLLASPADEDRVRLAVYYAVDWILRSNGAQFDVNQLVAGDLAPIDPILRPSTKVIEGLLERLTERGFLNALDPHDPGVTVSGQPDEGRHAQKVYWLSPEALTQLQLVARSGERGRAQVHDTLEPATGIARALKRAPRLREALEGRFVFDRLLSRGGLGDVWLARTTDGDPVAIKLMTYVAGQAHAGMRDLVQIQHPGVVRTREVIEGEKMDAQVMDLVIGRALSAFTFPLTTDFVVPVLDRLLDALDYLDRQGWARLDIKPHNILIQDSHDPVIIDLGTAFKPRDDPGDALTMIGTPLYMAPEIYDPAKPCDIRSDLYSLAVTMADALGGVREVLAAGGMHPSLSKRHLGGLAISSHLRDVLTRALAEDPAERYPAPADMRAALHETPEWRAASYGAAPPDAEGRRAAPDPKGSGGVGEHAAPV
jgi:hypothetical protein